MSHQELTKYLQTKIARLVEKPKAVPRGIQARKDGSELLRFSGLESVVTQQSAICVQAGSHLGTNIWAHGPTPKRAACPEHEGIMRKHCIPLLEELMDSHASFGKSSTRRNQKRWTIRQSLGGKKQSKTKQKHHIVAGCAFPNTNVCTDHTRCVFILQRDPKIRRQNLLKRAITNQPSVHSVLARLPDMNISYTWRWCLLRLKFSFPFITHIKTSDEDVNTVTVKYTNGEGRESFQILRFFHSGSLLASSSSDSSSANKGSGWVLHKEKGTSRFST